MKVVFDTNIYVSAFAIPGGRAGEAIKRIIDGTDRLVISREILDETLSVLARKFSKDADALSRAALFITALAETERPVSKVNVLPEGADNRVLECALAGKADAAITGDREMLALGEYEGVRIISLKEYLT